MLEGETERWSRLGKNETDNAAFVELTLHQRLEQA